jgi:hypothetical protein
MERGAYRILGRCRIFPAGCGSPSPGTSGRNLYPQPGISPQEFVGRDKAFFDFVFNELEDRNVRFLHKVEELKG